jgi:murein DD-endopeptidase MepM/ murein hydrolase activator NlpD
MDVERLSREVNFELSSYASIYDKVRDDIQRITHIPSIRPVNGGYMNSSFGYRNDPIDGVRRFHQGQDITVSTGAPIYAPADGKVKRAYYVGGFGNHIKLDHGFGYTTILAHMSKLYVKYGQKVNRGDIIGLSGNTGRSTAPHLHYEIHYYGTPQNPLDYFFTSASK